MNGLCRLSELKSLMQVTGAKFDDSYVTQIDEVSDEFMGEVDRQFYSSIGTRYFAGKLKTRLLLRCDLISVTTLEVDENGDGTYELTLVANTDYWLERAPSDPDGPYRIIELNPNSLLLRYWPKVRRGIKITGLWGYSNETENTTATTNEAVDASETVIDVTPDPTNLIDPGETIVIGSEQMYVSAVGPTTLTVTRGVNGTTAATHDTLTAIYRRRYPRDVEQAVKRRVAATRWGVYSGDFGDDAGAAGMPPDRVAYAQWMRTIGRYRLPAVGVGS